MFSAKRPSALLSRVRGSVAAVPTVAMACGLAVAIGACGADEAGSEVSSVTSTAGNSGTIGSSIDGDEGSATTTTATTTVQTPEGAGSPLDRGTSGRTSMPAAGTSAVTTRPDSSEGNASTVRSDSSATTTVDTSRATSTTTDPAGPTTTARSAPTTTTAPPTSATTTVAPRSEREGRPMRVATLGDSNTESGFWRASFQDVFRQEGCPVDMIGHRRASWTNRLDDHDLDTDAVSGAFLATELGPDNAIFRHGSSTLASGNADVVIIVGGTNDVLSQVLAGNANAKDHLTASLDSAAGHLADAMQRSSNATFFIADIVQMRDGEELVSFYNSGLARMADAAGSRAHHIAVKTSTSDLTDDGVHFTESGAKVYGAAIAGRVLGVARSSGFC